jgi:hypothetical protein
MIAGYDRGIQARYRIDLTSGRETLVDRLVGYDEIPQRSPDSRREYVVRMDSAADSAALIARVVGTTQDVVLFRERRIERAVLSPDGQYVGVVGKPNADERTGYVAIVPTAGGRPRIVHRAALPRRLGLQLDWTPDSRFLAFIEHDIEARAADLWKVGASADSAERVTRLSASPAYARISPDGHHLAYVDLAGPNVRELWAMENLPTSDRPGRQR